MKWVDHEMTKCFYITSHELFSENKIEDEISLFFQSYRYQRDQTSTITVCFGLIR